MSFTRILGLVAALGLGLGIGLTVFTQPDRSTASPGENLVITQGVVPNKAEIKAVGLKTTIIAGQEEAFSGKKQLIYLERTAKLNQGRPTGIAAPFNGQLLKEIRAVTLGNQLTLTGENNGLYHYRVIEIRVASRQELEAILAQPREVVVLYIPNGFFSDEVTMIIARPTKTL